ncbi:MAG: hypothetical protein JWQ04_3514 [Pedosphaera sp.]|nr:hypothetical protein [Pedosphaera sp.]
MKKFITSSLAAITLFTLSASRAFAGDLESMAGKWSLTATNDNGQTYTQALEIKKDKFTFRITDTDKKLVLIAKGDVKLDKCGDISSITFNHIEAGMKEDELSPVDDDRHCVYVLDGSSLTLALNFDRDREKGPRIEVYAKAQK